jgi:predicted N-acetyltransferase YhbS
LGETFRRITHRDGDWHERFFAFEERAFRVATTFRRWAERGGWHPGYEVFAIEEDGEILSTAGRERMRLVINGKEHPGYQLGAVATRSDRRKAGLSRRLLTWLLSEDDAPGLPVILFANPSVLDFYPRFGFTRIMQKRFVTAATVEPAANLAPTIDPDEPADRARLADLCRRARAPSNAFSARDYYPTLLWHLAYKPRSVFWFDGFDAAVIASVEHDRLTLHDVIAPHPFDLRLVLPRLTTNRVETLAFGFSPELWWPDARAQPADDPDSHFFVRGLPRLETDVFRFPDLAQT